MINLLYRTLVIAFILANLAACTPADEPATVSGPLATAEPVTTVTGVAVNEPMAEKRPVELSQHNDTRVDEYQTLPLAMPFVQSYQARLERARLRVRAEVRKAIEERDTGEALEIARSYLLVLLPGFPLLTGAIMLSFALRAIGEHRNAALVRDLHHLFQRHDSAEHIGHVRQSDHLGARAHGRS